MLDVGCGIGRNLQHLDADAVGVDHNQDSVTIARQRGLTAYVPEAFFHSPDACEGSFDSMLLAHVIEHLDADVADELARTYLPFLRSDVNGTYFGIPPRYGLTLVAPAAALTAVLLRGRRTGLGLLAVGLIGAVLVAVGTVR